MRTKQTLQLSRKLLLSAAFIATAALPAQALSKSGTLADTKAQYNDILSTFLPTSPESNFRVKQIGGHKDSMRIGSLMAYEFSSLNDCYVTLVNVNSEGTVNIVTPWEGELLKAGIPRQFPDQNSLEILEIQAPTGLETMAAFCSETSLIGKNGIYNDTSILAEGQDASVLLASMMDSISIGHSKFDRQIWSHRVVGRTDSHQYNDADVVSFFSQKTRSIKTRKLPLEITFKYNSAKLSENAKSTLNMIGKALESERLVNQIFRLGGHTDSKGSDAYNLQLSEQRASATKHYLTSKFSIDSSRLEIAPYGEHLPKADNASAEGRAENRRVELEQLD